ncbi:integrase [Photobacterium sp. NCIMB 13483]|uniref:site-specific integrase n=1 Tax=Photobacterium sp. NCIMB 13483 TaxID=2022103 RepID=UPI000D15F2E7|nr:site-specific integrase [Photobacterium sp. NCIMB 13483]PST87871.1 integrase [Photobacterium sp. NCIMB 13483]
MELSKKERIILIRHVENTYAEISSTPVSKQSISRSCGGKETYFLTPHLALDARHDIYLFPFLLNLDGSPWVEANLFLFSSATENKKGYTVSDALRQRASMLLDYKIFCDHKNIDLMNFSGRKPARPTYIYFFELLQQVNNGDIKRANLNKRTKVIYDFYKYLSEEPSSLIDLERVDTVESVRAFTKNSYGRSYGINIEKRGQSLAVSRQPNPVRIGFVREYGEELRPLRDTELEDLLKVLQTKAFSVDERLMHYIAMHTGARKQTILTMRMKHLNAFTPDKLLPDGTYKLNAGPGTGIDTKFNKPQVLYFPRALAEQICVYTKCQKAKDRRNKFVSKNGDDLYEEDMYIFLSPEGEPHYMAKTDPRYKMKKSRPQGRNTNYMKKKLLKYSGEIFPTDFTFHWLRATFALRYYRFLQPLSAKGIITDGDIVSMVQKRLHHSDRSTTEHYLKLFDSVDDRLAAQQKYEERVFDLYGIDSGVV